MKVSAIVQMTIEFEIHNAWDAETSLEHTYKDARQAAVSKINNCVQPNGGVSQLPEGTKLLNVKVRQVLTDD